MARVRGNAGRLLLHTNYHDEQAVDDSAIAVLRGRTQLVAHRIAPNLVALIERIWGTGEGRPAVHVSTDGVPTGHHIVERYTVVPSLANPKFLVPTESHATSADSFWKYNAMRSRRTRAGHIALAAAFRSGVAHRIFGDQLLVSCDDRLSDEERASHMLLAHLSRELNTPQLLAAMSVRRMTPNAKPTLQLFAPTGSLVGFAKLGWSPATRSMVQTESTSLEEVAGKLRSVVAPSVMAKGYWRERYYSVTKPLPEAVGRWTTPPAQAANLILEVAHSGEVARRSVAGSPYEHRLRDQLSLAGVTPETRVLSAWLDRLVIPKTQLDFGRWHGDWVSWNMARTGDKVAVWDWEHSAPMAPIGFDALHWYFQRTLPARGIDAAVQAVDNARHDLQAVGVSESAMAYVASLYLLEMFVRSVRLQRGGGGWNPRLHPRMLDFAAQRDR
jgi:hypothetical protein